MGNNLSSMFRRELLDVGTYREEFRKIGLVLSGGGAAAVVLNHNFSGFIAAAMGLLFYYFGLTEPKEETDGRD